MAKLRKGWSNNTFFSVVWNEKGKKRGVITTAGIWPFIGNHPLICKAEIRARWEVTEWQAIKGLTFSAFASGIAEVAYHELIMSVDLSALKSPRWKSQIKIKCFELVYCLGPRMDKAHHTVSFINIFLTRTNLQSVLDPHNTELCSSWLGSRHWYSFQFAEHVFLIN